MKTNIETLATLSELSRRANLPYPKVVKAVRAGILQPDFEIENGRMQLFRPSRIQQIREILNSKPEVVCQQG